MTKKEAEQLDSILLGNPWDIQKRLKDFRRGATIEEKEEPKATRTSQQNKALHLYLTHVAQALNEAGLPMQKVLTVDIDWNPENVKEYLWRSVQKSQLKKESTTQLTKAEVTQVYETLNRLLGEKFGVHVPFPNDEARALENLSGYKLSAHEESMDKYYEQDPTVKF